MKNKKKQLGLYLGYIGIFLLGLLTAVTAYSIESQSKHLTTVQLSNSPGYQEIERKAPIVAVNSDETAGIVGVVDVRLIPGSSNVLVDTSPFTEPDLQLSANTAVQVAKSVTGLTSTDKDFVFDYQIQSDVVGGGSAGAAETLAAIAALENKSIKTDVAISGTINADGTIGPVGGLLEKAKAVSNAGYKLFLVPQGEAITTIPQGVVQRRQMGPFVSYTTQVIPKTVDLRQQGLNLKIVEVSNVQDAMKYMLE